MTVENLNAYERETHLCMNDDEDFIQIETRQRRVINDQRSRPEFTETNSGFDGTTAWAEFTIPASEWTVSGGIKHRRNYTDEQKNELTRRLLQTTA